MLSENMIYFRAKNGITQEKMSELSGISKSQINKAENNKKISKNVENRIIEFMKGFAKNDTMWRNFKLHEKERNNFDNASFQWTGMYKACE